MLICANASCLLQELEDLYSLYVSEVKDFDKRSALQAALSIPDVRARTLEDSAGEGFSMDADEEEAEAFF
jgi:hypothetical protein